MTTKKAVAAMIAVIAMCGAVLTAPKTAEAATPTTTAPLENAVYVLVVAADFNNDGEAKLKEYFEQYRLLHEQFLGETLVYEWHYFPQNTIPKQLLNTVADWKGIDAIYAACLELFGQKYWQRVLISYEMEGGELCPYPDDIERLVLMQGFYAKQLGIHGEGHVLEGAIEVMNGNLRFESDNIYLDLNDKMSRFYLENGSCHFVAQIDVDRYCQQYGHETVTWDNPKYLNSHCDRTGSPLMLGNAKEALFAEKPHGIYAAGLCQNIGGRECEILHEMEVVQRLQQQFGVTLASLTPLHPKAKVPATTAATKAATPTTSKAVLNGKELTLGGYSIDGNSYFKLADLAFSLSETGKRFGVGYDVAKNAIALTSGQKYKVVGGEMAKIADGKKIAQLASSKVVVDGKAAPIVVYIIDGNSYVKLSDVATAFDFKVESASGKVVISTNSRYVTAKK